MFRHDQLSDTDDELEGLLTGGQAAETTGGAAAAVESLARPAAPLPVSLDQVQDFTDLDPDEAAMVPHGGQLTVESECWGAMIKSLLDPHPEPCDPTFERADGAFQSRHGCHRCMPLLALLC